jgi:hypothetical protein
MRTLIILIEMILIIAGLLALVGGLFYAVAWTALMAVQFFPVIGKRHRHPRWTELNRRSGRQ